MLSDIHRIRTGNADQVQATATADFGHTTTSVKEILCGAPNAVEPIQKIGTEQRLSD